MEDGHEEPLAPVDITKKLDSLENPTRPPIVMYKHMNHWDKFKTGLEPADQEIVDRLRKLKEEDKNNALSVDEIRRRLALLKDEDPDTSNHSINIHQVDTRTDQQKTDDLIQEYVEQLKLSSKTNSTSEIESRLQSLRDEDGEAKRCAGTEATSSADDEDDEAYVTKKLIAKALAETALDSIDEVEEMDVDGAKYTEDQEEKPSCVMCDQTELLERCMGCHGDLYCPLCFEDNHDDFELKKHKREPVTKLSPD